MFLSTEQPNIEKNVRPSHVMKSTGDFKPSAEYVQITCDPLVCW